MYLQWVSLHNFYKMVHCFHQLLTGDQQQPSVSRGGAGACLCANADHVNAMTRPAGDLVKEHTWGACWKATGNSRELDQVKWSEVDYGIGRKVWIKANQLKEEDDEKCSGSGGRCDRVRFVKRADWGARAPKSTTPTTPPYSMVFVHHTVIPDGCFTNDDCKAAVRSVQNMHMDSKGWDDIGYSFLVGQNGVVYEGRGWEHRPAQVLLYNGVSYGLAILGNLTAVLPTPQTQTAIKDMIDCGIKRGYITLGHEEFGHRDGGRTQCPGNKFYPKLQTWPRYSHRKLKK